MLDKIINSKTRISILSLLTSESGKARTAAEITSYTGLDPANVHKEISHLTRAGFIVEDQERGKKVFTLNERNPFHTGLEQLFRAYRDEAAGDEWFVLEVIPSSNPSIATTFMLCEENAKALSRDFGLKTVCGDVCIFEKGTSTICFNRREFREMAREVFEKVVDDTTWGFSLNEQVRSRSDAWVLVASKVYQTNLRELSDQELSKLYREFYDHQFSAHVTGWPSNVVDFEESMFSRHLLGILTARKDELSLERSVGEVFSTLTTPIEESHAQKEYKNLLAILDVIRRDGEALSFFRNHDDKQISDALEEKFPSIFRLIDAHRKSFGWLAYQFEGPGWSNDYFIGLLSSVARQDVDPAKALKEIREKLDKIVTQRAQYIREFRLTKQEQDLFRLAEEFVFLKGYRKDKMFYGMYCQEFLFREIARRAGLSLRQVRHMYPWEFERAILKKEVDPDELNERFEYHVLSSDRDNTQIIAGDDARKFVAGMNFIEQRTGNERLLDGDTASPGKVRGTVSVINLIEEMEKMKEGAVLVSQATNPSLMPAIRKAAAIVTDMGGVTCHAAIVSRELGIPCVVGTKIATKALADGDVVEVDASHGRVHILTRQSDKNKAKAK
ncbi:MAG: PEP-utilizing enzyme [Patescibacteria group bacterium]|nr:PEP-utilizing enzyme [Patescibacteria group bacterium]